MAIYERAKKEVTDLVAKIMKKFHGELDKHGVTIDCLMASPTTSENGDSQGPPLKIKGYPCAAIVKINSTKNRVAGLSDAEICFDADRWKQFKDEEKAALVDHELAHLNIKKDKDEAVVFDDLGRPRLRMRPHDREVGWFDEVVRRNKAVALEFQQMNAIWRGCNSQLGFDFMQQIG